MLNIVELAVCPYCSIPAAGIIQTAVLPLPTGSETGSGMALAFVAAALAVVLVWVVVPVCLAILAIVVSHG